MPTWVCVGWRMGAPPLRRQYSEAHAAGQRAGTGAACRLLPPRGLVEEAEIRDVARRERRLDEAVLQDTVEVLLERRVAHAPLDAERRHDLVVDRLGGGRVSLPLTCEDTEDP